MSLKHSQVPDFPRPVRLISYIRLMLHSQMSTVSDTAGIRCNIHPTASDRDGPAMPH
jgi:hypothetical protein